MYKTFKYVITVLIITFNIINTNAMEAYQKDIEKFKYISESDSIKIITNTFKLDDTPGSARYEEVIRNAILKTKELFKNDKEVTTNLYNFLSEKNLLYILNSKRFSIEYKNVHWYNKFLKGENLDFTETVNLIATLYFYEEKIINYTNSIKSCLLINKNSKITFSNNINYEYDFYFQTLNILKNIARYKIADNYQNNNRYIFAIKFVIEIDKDLISIYNTVNIGDKKTIKLSIYKNQIVLGNEVFGFFKIDPNNEIPYCKKSEGNNIALSCYNFIKYKESKNQNFEYYFSYINNEYKIFRYNEKNKTFSEKNNKFRTNNHQQIIVNDSPFICSHTNEVFFIRTEEKNKSFWISFIENKIKLTLFNSKDAITFDLNFDNQKNNNNEFSYFKNNVTVKIDKDKPINPFFDFITKPNPMIRFENDGYICHIYREKFYSFNTQDSKTNAIFYYDDNTKINCYLNAQVNDLLSLYTPNKFVFYKNLDKNKNIIIDFYDGVSYNHENKEFTKEKDLLYKLDNEYYINYFDENLYINFYINAYNKIKIIDKNGENISNFWKYIKNLQPNTLKNSYKNFLDKIESFKNYFMIISKLYNKEIEEAEFKNKNNLDIEKIIRIFEESISKQNNEINEIKTIKNVELNTEYTSDFIINLLENSNFYKSCILHSIDNNKNKKEYKIIFVNDIKVNNESLKDNLIEEDNEINQNILDLLNNNENNATLIDYLYKISKGKIPKNKGNLIGNLGSIIHIYVNNILRLFFKYDHEKNRCYVYYLLTHTKQGMY